jgi:hypothetical protein
MVQVPLRGYDFSHHLETDLSKSIIIRPMQHVSRLVYSNGSL